MPTVDNMLVTENQTIDHDFLVNGNQTLQNGLFINGSETIQGSLQVNGSERVVNNLGVGSEISAGGSVSATFRTITTSQASVPIGSASVQQVRYYATSALNQPGIVLKGTDGVDYVLFIDTTGGSVNIGIQKV